MPQTFLNLLFFIVLDLYHRNILSPRSLIQSPSQQYDSYGLTDCQIFIQLIISRKGKVSGKISVIPTSNYPNNLNSQNTGPKAQQIPLFLSFNNLG